MRAASAALIVWGISGRDSTTCCPSCCYGGRGVATPLPLATIRRPLGQHAVLPLPTSGDGGWRLAVGNDREEAKVEERFPRDIP
jgi:hypothetical protein